MRKRPKSKESKVHWTLHSKFQLFTTFGKTPERTAVCRTCKDYQILKNFNAATFFESFWFSTVLMATTMNEPIMNKDKMRLKYRSTRIRTKNVSGKSQQNWMTHRVKNTCENLSLPKKLNTQRSFQRTHWNGAKQRESTHI